MSAHWREAIARAQLNLMEKARARLPDTIYNCGLLPDTRGDSTVACGSLPIISIPKRSAASSDVLNCKVTGRPSLFHAVSPPSRTQTFEMPLFRSATATRALVNSPEEEQYRTSPRLSGTTTRNRLRR